VAVILFMFLAALDRSAEATPPEEGGATKTSPSSSKVYDKDYNKGREGIRIYNSILTDLSVYEFCLNLQHPPAPQHPVHKSSSIRVILVIILVIILAIIVTIIVVNTVHQRNIYSLSNYRCPRQPRLGKTLRSSPIKGARASSFG
jgi:hypothetical protein